MTVVLVPHFPMKSSARLIVFVSLFLAAAGYAADAAANWGQHCAKCHGDDGKGQTKMGKRLKIRDLTDGAVQATFNDEAAFNAMKVGVTDDKGKVTMKPVEELSDDEMKALVAYIRGLKK
jgi:cytochrome c553